MPVCVFETSVLCPQNVNGLSPDRPCSVPRLSMLCPQNVCTLSADCPCSVCRSSVLCPPIIHALSTERSYSVHRLSVLCPLIVRALSTEHPCSVCAACASVYCVSLYPQSNWLAKSPIVVARTPLFPKSLIVVSERKSPNDAQLHDIVKWFVKLTKLRGLTAVVTTSRRRRRLTMWYSLMSLQSNWSATEEKAFERRRPESWSIGISIHWKSMWWEISKQVATQLVIFSGIMNATKYENIFSASLLLFIQEEFPDSHQLYQDTQANIFRVSLKGTVWRGGKPSWRPWPKSNWTCVEIHENLPERQEYSAPRTSRNWHMVSGPTGLLGFYANKTRSEMLWPSCWEPFRFVQLLTSVAIP